MAYIGQDPVIGRYILVDQISGGFNGTASGFTLAAGGQGVIPGLAQNVLLSLGGVIQQPGTDYTVSGSGITFTTPPLSGTTFFATVLGDVQAVGTPSDGTVLPASIATSGTFVFPNITTTGTTLIASGNASTPSLAVIGDTNTGLYSPGADQLSITTGGTERFRIDSAGQLEAVSLGTAAAPTFSFTTDPNTGIYSPGADQLAISTNGTGRLFVDASGQVGIGGSPGYNFDVISTGDTSLRIRTTGTTASDDTLLRSSIAGTEGSNYLMFGDADNGAIGSIRYNHSSDNLSFTVNASERLRITSAGNVGIGTTSPGSALDVVGTGKFTATQSLIINGTSGTYSTWQHNGTSVGDLGTGNQVLSGGSTGDFAFTSRAGALVFGINTAEKARLDTSGRLLVGTSTAGGTELIQVQGTSGGSNLPGGIALRRSSLANGDDIGYVNFTNASGNIHASIKTFCDGTPGASDYPGALTFSTTADGASSPTARATINSAGDFLVGKTAENSATAGFQVRPAGLAQATVSGDRCLDVNRLTNDGTLVVFSQDNTQEGTISVSGTTVSYNGAHLSRWSQLPAGAERIEILRGSVLSNLDEMCEWGDEENEQLNRMNVSDVEGDKNVSGVFQAWDDDDDTYTNDFYCAMTGDFIIRIGADTTVERGDLLMSAGNGTAKPQDDDIIRSKTIAKVTSTNVSCTYDDGSYCVPCVLMAC